MFSLFRENIRIAYDSIRSQLLRTILTVVIIAIGITALVAILSLVKALENTISSDFSSMLTPSIFSGMSLPRADAEVEKNKKSTL